MNLLSVNNLAKIGREKPLFTGVTFGLNEGDKAALIGRNGTGKSTLLNTIAGLLSPDEGTVVLNKEAGVSFLAQNPLYSKDDTIKSHIFKFQSPKLKTIREYEESCDELQKTNSQQAQQKFNTLNEKMQKDNLWNYESQIKSILTTLGINDLSHKAASFGRAYKPPGHFYNIVASKLSCRNKKISSYGNSRPLLFGRSLQQHL